MPEAAAVVPARLAGVPRAAWLWGLSGALALVAWVCWELALVHYRQLPTPLRLPWPVLVATFALGHAAEVRFQYHRHYHSLDLTDASLLAAIVFLAPGYTLLSVALGTILWSLIDRRSALKVAINPVVHALSATVAILVYHAALAGASPMSAQGAAAAVAALLASELTGNAAVRAAIALSGGPFSPMVLAVNAVALLPTVVVDAVVGLTSVHLLWGGLGGGLLFLAGAGITGYTYSAYGRVKTRYTTLDELYQFERGLAGVIEPERVITTVLEKALGLLNAEVVQLVEPGPITTITHTLRAEQTRTTVEARAHPLAKLVLGEDAFVLARRQTHDRRLRSALAGLGFRDAIAYRLPSDADDEVKVLVVADRRGGDNVTFHRDDLELVEAIATPTAMALRSSGLLEQLRAEIATKEYQASHDALTGLANRRLFTAEVDRALDQRGEQALVGLMIIDLDGFKTLNDSLGHEAGDLFLQHLGQSLKSVVEGRGVVGRLGGDEFAAVVTRAEDPAEIVSIANNLSLAAQTPVAIADTSVSLGASIGVSIAPTHSDDRFTLMRQADLAMYRAKQLGGGVAVHDDASSGQIDRPSLVAAIREAIRATSLDLHYQPKVRFDTGEVVGVEALLRWTHPRYGAIDPEQFIPVAESSGLIRPLTRWVLDAVMTQCAAWRREGLELNTAVNLSPVQLDDPTIVTDVRQLLEAHDLPPSLLTLEITESRALTGPLGDQHVLEPLAELGVRLSIDDFGVGTSSLARVKHLPVREVKIDKSFIVGLAAGGTDDAIVSSVIALVHRLGLEVVAEGVESQATYRRLASLGCDIAQGFLISAPLHPAELALWALSRRQQVASGAFVSSGTCELDALGRPGEGVGAATRGPTPAT